MQYLFKQAVHLSGKIYKLGVNEVPEKVENDPHFLKYIGAGLIVDVDPLKSAKLKTQEERAEEILNKLHAEKKISKPVLRTEKGVKAPLVADKEPVTPSQTASPVAKKKDK